MTREDILKSNANVPKSQHEGTFIAMDEFAKQEAISFAQWTQEQDAIMLLGTFAWERLGDPKQYSSEEFYQLYLKSITV